MSSEHDRYARLAHLAKRLSTLHAKSLRAAEARHALMPGSTRARVTTANARWRNAAEARDDAMEDLARELRDLGINPQGDGL